MSARSWHVFAGGALALHFLGWKSVWRMVLGEAVAKVRVSRGRRDEQLLEAPYPMMDSSSSAGSLCVGMTSNSYFGSYDFLFVQRCCSESSKPLVISSTCGAFHIVSG